MGSLHVYAFPQDPTVHAIACAGLEEGGSEAILRATERVRQAALPAYANLFTPISNQPQGGLRTCNTGTLGVHVAVIHDVERWWCGRAQVPGGHEGGPTRMHTCSAIRGGVTAGPGEGAAVRRSHSCRAPVCSSSEGSAT